MNKWLVFLLIVILLGSVFFFFWQKYEKPIQEEIKNNINLSIFSNENGKRVVTGYEIYVNNEQVYNGTTLVDGLSFVSVTKNHELEVRNYNLEGQNYYIDRQKINTTSINLTQVRLKLEKPSPLNVQIVNDYLNEEYLIFNLTTSNLFKNLVVCSEWGINIIYLKGDYEPFGMPPENYKTYDKCFNIGETLNSTSNVTLEFNYKQWGNFNDDDFLRFVFIDQDLGKSIDEEGNDLWANDTLVDLDLLG